MQRSNVLFHFLVLLAFASQAQAQEPTNRYPISSFNPTEYVRIAGASRVSIEVPKDWKVQSIQSLAELNKENRRNGKPMNLEVLASAERLTSGAIITIAVQSPPNWTQRRLSSAKESDLQATSKAISQEAFGKLSPSGIGKVVTGPTYEVQTFPNTSAKYLAVSYREEETLPKGHVITWKTTHLYLPRQTDELEIIFAYHEKHEQFWRPVMEKALTTLQH